MKKAKAKKQIKFSFFSQSEVLVLILGFITWVVTINLCGGRFRESFLASFVRFGSRCWRNKKKKKKEEAVGRTDGQTDKTPIDPRWTRTLNGHLVPGFCLNVSKENWIGLVSNNPFDSVSNTTIKRQLKKKGGEKKERSKWDSFSCSSFQVLCCCFWSRGSPARRTVPRSCRSLRRRSCTRTTAAWSLTASRRASRRPSSTGWTRTGTSCPWCHQSLGKE